MKKCNSDFIPCRAECGVDCVFDGLHYCCANYDTRKEMMTLMLLLVAVCGLVSAVFNFRSCRRLDPEKID